MLSDEDVRRIARAVANELEERKEARRVAARKEQCSYCAHDFPLKPGSSSHIVNGRSAPCIADTRLLP